MPANLENLALGTGLENVSIHSNPKEGQCQEIALILHTSKVMLKIFQARPIVCELWTPSTWTMNFHMFKMDLEKEEETRGQIASICWIIEKAREFQESIYFCFIDYAKAFDYVDHNKLWKTLQEMGIPEHLTCLLRNLRSSSRSNS